MAKFQAKIGRKKMRKIENKNYLFVPFLPTRNRKFQKNGKNIQKIQEYQCGFIKRQNRHLKAEKKRK